MTQSKNSSNTSKIDAVQLPQKGMHAEIPEARAGWKTTIESLGDGRYRVHTTKTSK